MMSRAIASLAFRFCMAVACGAFVVTPTMSAGREPSETPRARPTPRGYGVDSDCDASCDTFRRECLPYCEQNGHIPNARFASDDCKTDCRAFESQCLDACLRNEGRGVPFFPAPPRR